MPAGRMCRAFLAVVETVIRFGSLPTVFNQGRFRY